LRIIGGTFGGRRVTPPGNLPVRPTTDMAREALFNLLQTRAETEGAIVIDLFGGTGFISYEFCSRGASKVIVVEENPRCVMFIKNTAEQLGMNTLSVIRGDAFRFLKSTMHKADIIFADPPYDHPGIAALPDLVFDHQIVAPDGWFILEHGRTYDFSPHKHFRELRHYGKVHFSFFR